MGSEKESLYGNFSTPMYSVSKASEPSVLCSSRFSSDSASFSFDLSLWKPLRPRLTPADRIARISSCAFTALFFYIKHCSSLFMFHSPRHFLILTESTNQPIPNPRKQ